MYQQKGLSLIELMISITLGLILMTGVVQMFLSSRTTFVTLQGISRVQETGRLSIDFIAQDVRMAGFTGFDSLSGSIIDGIVPFSATNNYGMGVVVLTPAASGITAALAGTDVLYIHGALLGDSATIVGQSATGLITIPSGTTVAAGCTDGSSRLNGFCKDEVMVIADYFKARVFQPTNIAASGANLAISFAGGWGSETASSNVNDYFVDGAQISRMSRVVYYIANRPTTTIPCLYQQVNGAAALELLEGVRDMYITYSRAATPTTFLPAVSVIGPLWANLNNPVVSVRIELVTQSVENNMVETPQTYVFKGANVTATDRRMYQVFTTTIAMRNRLN